MNTAIMKCWSVGSNQNGFKPQELVRYHLRGLTHEDTSGRFYEGAPIKTGTILSVADRGTHKVIKTKNTAYSIYPEDIDPTYEARFPGAYERIPCQEEVRDG